MYARAGEELKAAREGHKAATHFDEPIGPIVVRKWKIKLSMPYCFANLKQ